MMVRILIICMLMASCSASKYIETDLYFGQTRPDGSLISEADWNNFKETHIARIFAKGSTTISAKGSWFDPEAHKLISEPSYVVSNLHKRSAYISRQIDTLRNLYVTMFQQQAVLRVDRKVKASF